jgi:mono/diheme cytochrome c family protein
MAMRTLLLIALWLAPASVVAQTPSTATPAPAGDAAKGRSAFVEYNCSWCHGTEGQGGLPGNGPRIARVARSLPSFIGYVRKPTTRMSAYSGASISDAVLNDIYAYLRSLPDAKPAVDVPLLDQLRKPGR